MSLNGDLHCIDMIDLSFDSTLEPGKGRLLISDPFLEDDYFKRSVVLLCEHNDQGSFGFVLNHYIDVRIGEIVTSFPDVESKVSMGGPVSTDNVYYIHTLGEVIPGSTEIMDGVYMGGEFESIKEKILMGTMAPKDIRFFVGYSGWSENQLMDELEQKAWIVSQTSGKEIMNTGIDKLWKKTLERQGKKYQIISTFPENFRLN